MLGDCARGDDPAQDKQERRDAETFRGLAQSYLEVAEKRHRSWKEEKRIIDKDLLPELGLWWSIPATVAKNDRTHRVPISEGVVEILSARRVSATEGAIFVFENRPGSGPAATRAYDRYNYDAEKRHALGRWARGLAAIIEGKTMRVVAFRA